MAIELHANCSIQSFKLGEEKAPLLVVDNLVANPQALVAHASSLQYEPPKMAYPGIRALAPREYQQFLLQQLMPKVIEYFAHNGPALRLSMCHYSLVTTRPENLNLVQRIPHVDAFDSNGLATVHYLFQENMGGTAFYRHRKTGYEVIDESRKMEYITSLESEMKGSTLPPAEYINGDTPLFEQIGKQEGLYNRLLIYRRNSLHSGCIDKNFKPVPNPQTGRLSINSFIDLV